MNRMAELVTRFILDIDPPTITAQEARIAVVKNKVTGKHIPKRYKQPELADVEEKYLAYLSQHKPDQPVDGPVELCVEWYFGTKTRKLDNRWKTTKPDTDNLNKLLKDCMTKAGFWHDDAQVAIELISKKWSMNPCIVITIYKLDGDQHDS